MAESKKTAKKTVRVKSKTEPKSAAAKKAPSKKSKTANDLVADDILLLTRELDPDKQQLLHRFALRLQSTIAIKFLKYLGVYTGVVTFALVFMAIMYANNYQLIAVDGNGRLWDVKAHEEVVWTDSKVISFANETVLETLDINFQNFSRRLESVTNDRYTGAGKTSLEKMMRPVIQTLQNTKGALYIETTNDAGQIVGRSSDHFLVRREYLITLKPAEGEGFSNRRNITIRLERVEDMENLKGLAASQIVQGA